MLKAILEVETAAPTVDGAVTQALAVLGCGRADVETTILQTPSRRFFGLLGGRPARVHLRLTDRACIGRRLLEHLLRLSGLPARVETQPRAREIELHIHSDIPGMIIGRRGQTLEALLSVVVMLADRVSTDRTPFLLVTNGYQTRRSGSLGQPLHGQGGRVFPSEGAGQQRRAGRSCPE